MSWFGNKKTEIFVADIQGNRTGPTILITAGMDGDEYAGIEAAYQLIETFAAGNFFGRLIIVPIVNVFGFFGEVSYNPIDGKFPKNVFPGSANGTSTEQLLDWLVRTYVREASVWYDMHSGAITEGLNPFLWTFETGVSELDTFSKRFCEARDAELIVIEQAKWGSKQAHLAKMGCAYICAEAGERGRRAQEAIEQHVRWARAALSHAGLFPCEANAINKKVIIRKISYVMAPFEGFWRMQLNELYHKKEVKKGEVIGVAMRLDGTKKISIHASATGIPLWWKETAAMRHGDVLMAIGSNESTDW
jgi:uncharacterized protein